MQETVIVHCPSHSSCNFPLFSSYSKCLIARFLHPMPDGIKLICLFYVVQCYILPLYTSTLHAHISTFLLMTSSMFSNVATSLKISSIIPSSLSPPMNCPVSSLLYSLYAHSSALVHSLPINSWTAWLLFLCHLWDCSDIKILLCHGLNLLLKTEKKHFAVLHFSFP